MKRVVEGETLEAWFAGTLQPKLELAIERGVIRAVQAEDLVRQMEDLWRSGEQASALSLSFSASGAAARPAEYARGLAVRIVLYPRS